MRLVALVGRKNALYVQFDFEGQLTAVTLVSLTSTCKICSKNSSERFLEAKSSTDNDRSERGTELQNVIFYTVKSFSLMIY